MWNFEVFVYYEVKGEGRNRPFPAAFAFRFSLILRAIQYYSAVFGLTGFYSLGVRFGVRKW